MIRRPISVEATAQVRSVVNVTIMRPDGTVTRVTEEVVLDLAGTDHEIAAAAVRAATNKTVDRFSGGKP